VHILVTNDDGIDSEGLHVLARAMSEHGRVTVVAPATENSGAGAAIGALHLMEPELHPAEIDGVDAAWKLTGTPALCAMFARMGAFGDIDLIVSGINPGANVGRSVYHSGTIGAAITGRIGGIPGVAVSQAVTGFGVMGQGWDEAIVGQKWHAAAAVASELVGGLISHPPHDTYVINLNVPDLEVEEMKGWRYTEVGLMPPRAIQKVELIPHVETDGAYKVEMHWGDAVDLPLDIDAGAVMHEYVSVSYLSQITALEPHGDQGVTQALDRMFQP
jgi:5'-nucleotidase